MGRSRFKFHEEHYPYFLTHTIVDGVPLFDDPVLAEVILGSLTFIQNEFRLRLYAYVLMHNHLHMIVEGADVSEKIRKFKSYTARQIIRSLEQRNRIILLSRIKQGRVSSNPDSEYQVWQEGSYPKQVNTVKKMEAFISYLHYNPVKSGFVEKPEHWRYSSAAHYAGLEALINVTAFEG